MAGNKKKNRVLGYFKDVKGELKKVVWPSFKQVKNNTLIVIACVLIIGAFIWILDAIFGLSLGKVVEKWQAPEAVEQTTTTTPAADDSVGTEEIVAPTLEELGVKYDEATETYTDAESGAVLTEDEVNARMFEAMGIDPSAIEGTDTSETGTEGGEPTGEETPAEPTAAE